MASNSHHGRNSMDSIDIAKSIAPQPTGVPADYLDPNHPQFPHDIEAQPSSHRSFWRKKSTKIVAAARNGQHKAAPYGHSSGRNFDSAYDHHGCINNTCRTEPNDHHSHHHAPTTYTNASAVDESISSRAAVFVDSTQDSGSSSFKAFSGTTQEQREECEKFCANEDRKTKQSVECAPDDKGELGCLFYIELKHFPKNLPLRPEKRSHILTVLKKKPMRTATTIICLLVTIAGVALSACTAKPGTSLTTAVMTQTSVTSQVQTMDEKMRSTVVVTTTVPWSSSVSSSAPVGASKTTSAEKKKVTASPGRQKPQK
ncbi:hypothetical protein CC86DRAFT_419469 [Ophiobolus disseminans]|uniref:Uncharacterized protein n=1 Tax=Ophiobolus disseminans TaxID=1469910 RepID=A0A6A6ZX71_9PLEO|nr:hypothetical protein CC86DRAFT_419469 [Ophiobolus disseminans]